MRYDVLWYYATLTSSAMTTVLTVLCWNVVSKQAILVQSYTPVKEYEILNHLYHEFCRHLYWVSRLCLSPNIPKRIQRVLKISTLQRTQIVSPNYTALLKKRHWTDGKCILGDLLKLANPFPLPQICIGKRKTSSLIFGSITDLKDFFSYPIFSYS
jgi:hypothetical protein